MRDINIGTTGTRVEITGQVRTCEHRFTQWGTSTDLVLVTPAGVKIKWTSSHRIEMNPGDPIGLKATIKTYGVGAIADVEVTRGELLTESALLF